jgi:hypothetical protein
MVGGISRMTLIRGINGVNGHGYWVSGSETKMTRGIDGTNG